MNNLSMDERPFAYTELANKEVTEPKDVPGVKLTRKPVQNKPLIKKVNDVITDLTKLYNENPAKETYDAIISLEAAVYAINQIK
jgi:hypothetical protein